MCVNTQQVLFPEAGQGSGPRNKRPPSRRDKAGGARHGSLRAGGTGWLSVSERCNKRGAWGRERRVKQWETCVLLSVLRQAGWGAKQVVAHQSTECEGC